MASTLSRAFLSHPWADFAVPSVVSAEGGIMLCHLTSHCYVAVVTPMNDSSWKTLYTVSRGQVVDDCLDGCSLTPMWIQHAVRCCTAVMIWGVAGLLSLLLSPKTSMEMLSMFQISRWVKLSKSACCSVWLMVLNKSYLWLSFLLHFPDIYYFIVQYIISW